MTKQPLSDKIAARQRQRDEGVAEERSFFRGLAVAGGLGWMIVLPTLAGLALGRWLDGLFACGITWTGALLMAGLALGCRWAWSRIHHP